MKRQKEILLVDYQSSINTRVLAGLELNGDLYIYGYDTGNLPSSGIYDDDVEYRLDIPAVEMQKVYDLIVRLLRNENRVVPDDLLTGHQDGSKLLDLLNYYYQGDVRTFGDFKELLEKNSIDHIFNWG